MIAEKQFYVKYSKFFLTENYGNITYYSCIINGFSEEDIRKKFEEVDGYDGVITQITEVKF